MLQRAAVPIAHLEILATLEKNTDTTIDSLIQQLEQLRTRLKSHIKAYQEQKLIVSALRKKLSQKETVQNAAEASGDAMHRLLSEVNQESQENPQLKNFQ